MCRQVGKQQRPAGLFALRGAVCNILFCVSGEFDESVAECYAAVFVEGTDGLFEILF